MSDLYTNNLFYAKRQSSLLTEPFCIIQRFYLVYHIVSVLASVLSWQIEFYMWNVGDCFHVSLL